jgi:SAM-dependent methyltransferase
MIRLTPGLGSHAVSADRSPVAYLDELHTVLGALTRTNEHSDAVGFIERNQAIDDLEVHLFELTRSLNQDDVGNRRVTKFVTQVVTLRDRLQGINDSMVQRLRGRIAAASISPRELLTTFQQYVNGASQDTRDDVKYDDLDVLVAAILSTDQVVDEGTVELEPEMVPYQPTPARLILALLQEIRLTERDVFVDVGSGLGTVPTLVSLLTGARAVGIEWQPSYYAQAQHSVRDLNLSSVSFVRQDARDADFSTGTIFYMFTPFKGTMLRDVLQRLDSEARRRTIRLCIHGPLLREAIHEFSSFSMEEVRRDDFISVFQSLPAA